MFRSSQRDVPTAIRSFRRRNIVHPVAASSRRALLSDPLHTRDYRLGLRLNKREVKFEIFITEPFSQICDVFSQTAARGPRSVSLL
jgi:hypothetical protein